MILEWKPRWCVLSADGSTLCYYEPWCPWTGGQLQLVNTVPLATAEITRHEYKGKRFCFYINAPRTLQVISAPLIIDACVWCFNLSSTPAGPRQTH